MEIFQWNKRRKYNNKLELTYKRQHHLKNKYYDIYIELQIGVVTPSGIEEKISVPSQELTSELVR